MSDSVFVGRFPIFDHASRTVAYELVVRDGINDEAPFEDADRAARRLMSSVVHRIGLDELIGGRTAWVPTSAGLLLEGLHTRLPPRRTVLQLTLDSWRREGVHDIIGQARRAGFRVALDASEGKVGDSAIQTLAGAADLGALRQLDAVKLGLNWLDPREWKQIATDLGHHSLLSVAVGADTRAVADSCAQTFDLVQGRFTLDATVVDGSSRVDRLAAMQLISELERPNVTFEDVERIISLDPSLSFRVLQLANSGMFSLPRRIDTIRGALVMLGLRNVRQMALMVSLSSVGDVPGELTATALVRARQCEKLAAFGGQREDIGFTVGLLSLIDVFAGLPVDQALGQLPITEEVRAAIEHREGPLGWTLACAVACEQGTIAALSADPPKGFYAPDIDVLTESYTQAVSWAERVRAGEHINISGDRR